MTGREGAGGTRLRSFLAAWPPSGGEPDRIYGLMVNREDEPRELRKSDIVAVLDALAEVEFVHGICPACSWTEPDHEPDCVTAAALGAS